MRILILALALLAGSARAADAPIGDWTTEGGLSRVRIGPCAANAATLCGQIIWLAEPLNAEGKPKLDRNNPDPVRQTQPIVGLAIVTGMKPDGVGKWSGGEIYDPQAGKSYNSNMKLGTPGELLVEGCVFFLCRGQSWRELR